MTAALDRERIVGVLTGMFPSGAALHEPEIAGNEWNYVKECLDSGWVSTHGAFIGRFEEMLVDFTGAAHAIATVNGTAALHACLVLAGVEAGDEVIVPTLTFVATANAVAHRCAIPHFADSEETTLGMCAAKLDAHLGEIAEDRGGVTFNRATGRPIRAVVPMHTFGHPADLDSLLEVCRRHRVAMIEDAAESLGSFHRQRHTGNLGLLAALSFNGNKIMTTGGGGAILTNDKDLAAAARHLTTTARLPHAFEFIHDRVAYNYRMPNLNAAMGCAQMERLEDFLVRKRILAERYRDAFAGIDGIRFFEEPAGCRSNYWLNALVLEPEYAGARDTLIEALNEAGLMCRPAWTPMHRLAMFEDCPRMDLSVAESLYARLINIPSSPCLAGAADA